MMIIIRLLSHLNLYNDLDNPSTTGDLVLFANDTNKTAIEFHENAQIVLNEIHESMFSNQLHINLTKSYLNRKY